MGKGAETREAILRTALGRASEVGLEGLSIGQLANRMQMSKSGLFAHFGSKADLQIAVLSLASELFVDRVIRPAIALERGEPRVRAMFENWLEWSESKWVPGGCIFITTAYEFDQRPGPVRDALKEHVTTLRGTLTRATEMSIEQGHFRADLDCAQFVYQLHAIMLAHHVESGLMANDDAHERALAAYQSLVGLAAPPG